MESHLAVCTMCRDTVRALERWEHALASEGAHMRGALDRDPQPDFERLLSESLQRLRVSPATPRPLTAAHAILALRRLLDPLLGAGAVSAAVELAIRKSGGPDGAVPSRWHDFVNAFGEEIASAYGIAAARLVELAGASLGNDLAAVES